MLSTQNQVQNFEIPGGTKGYIYPSSPCGGQTIAVVEMDGVYPERGYSLNDRCTETIFMQEGSFVMEVNGEQFEMKAGDVFAIQPGNKYRIWGKGKSIDVISPAWDKAQNHIIVEDENYKLMYASTRDANLFYAVRGEAHDPSYYIETPTKKYFFLDHRELGVFQEKNTNPQLEAVLLNPYLEKAVQLEGDAPTGFKLGFVILREYGLLDKEFQVPANFPIGLADYLRKQGIKLKSIDAIFTERRTKTADEIATMRDVMRRLTKAFDRIEDVLKESMIAGEVIKFQGVDLTSEILKKEVNKVLLDNDLLDTEGMIISCGAQAAMPHHQGVGLLRPNQTIICDIFPKDMRSGYYGDMTRTYVKGAPSERVQKMFDAVLSAQQGAIAMIKPGIAGAEVYGSCVHSFLSSSFDVGEKGFVHGTGHGLGLDIHESPYLNKVTRDVLAVGDVFSVEPGLYYSEDGGIRIEDICAITDGGVENLTSYRNTFVIA